jgi:4-cresol dehydrogenase (hydroxylating) flavoprotein subunit
MTSSDQQEQKLRDSFGAILGEERARFDRETRDGYARTTGVQGSLPAGVVYPECTREVVKLANALRVPLYPISRGKNWGYGDACAPSDGQIVVDLSHMNAIRELNLERAYVVVEPGVTQGQLYNYLRARGARLWMDSTGAGPDTSLVGNILDRGFGHTRYGDHFQTCCGLEVVLADGTLFQTGFGHFENAKANMVFKYGIGPVLDGLFSQSNFGIVTRAGIYLMPEPEDFCAFFFCAEHDADLDHVIRVLAALRLQGTLQSTVHIANDLRVIAGKMRYPWERAGGKIPLPEDIRAELRREHGIGAWNGAGSIAGPKELVSAIRLRMKRELKSVHPLFIDNKRMARLQRLQTILRAAGVARALQSKIDLGAALFHTLKGVPSPGAIPGAWWRVRRVKDPRSLDPIENGAGILWISPVLAADPTEARNLVGIIKPIYSKYGFDTLITFTLVTERAMVCVSNIAFDRSNSEECGRAQICHDELITTLISQGYIPYRAGPASFKSLALESSPFWQVASRLKHALDPNGIISPGRYIPASDRRTV